MTFRAAVGTVTVKVYVVFDDAGRIQAISHPIPGRNGAPPTLGRFARMLANTLRSCKFPLKSRASRRASCTTPSVSNFTPACPA
jgi:hypothetical protein